MSMKYRVVLGSAVALLAVSALSGCNEKETTQPAAASAAVASAPAISKDDVAATVNGTPISKKQLDQIMLQQASQGMPDNPETRKLVIDNLAMQLLVAQEAVTKGLDKTPEVTEQIEMTRQSILANAFIRDYTKTASVTDDALKAEYDKFKAQSGGNQFKARHILVEKEDEAKEIITKLKKDAKAFDGLAKSKSKDPGSKGKGGDLGWFDARSMVPEFSAAVAKLEKGKFTEEPVKSQFGYHVIILDDTRPVTVPSFEELKPGLTQQLQQQNLKKLLDDIKAKAKIDITPTPAPAAASAPAVSAAPASATAATPAAAAPADAAKK